MPFSRNLLCISHDYSRTKLTDISRKTAELIRVQQGSAHFAEALVQKEDVCGSRSHYPGKALPPSGHENEPSKEHGESIPGSMLNRIDYGRRQNPKL